MTANEIRQAYLDFFKQQNHKKIPRAKLIPENDPTTLFTGSGMQPLLPYLLGENHPAGKRLVDSQPSFRAEDIDEVGDNRHTTFFEMLGNWSLGDYFKAEQLPWFWQFLTEQIKLDPQKLYVSVFGGDNSNQLPKDAESAQIWQDIYKANGIDAKVVDLSAADAGAIKGMQGGRIFYYDASKNWWSRNGPPDSTKVGDPCGPDSEVFYEFTDIKHDSKYGRHCHPNCDCGRYLEIGNSVFMQYVKTDGGFKELPQQNVDFGGGLERIAMAALNTPDIFKISLMWPIIEELQLKSGKQYADNIEAMRVIADHLRGAIFLATDGVAPSNKDRGYVLRRLLRRAIRYGLDLGIEQGLFKITVPAVTKVYKGFYPEVAESEAQNLDLLGKEEALFRQTLRRGLREFEKQVGKSLSGETIFTLFDTYGFPMELSLEEAKKRNIKLDKDWQKSYEAMLGEQRERSRTATKGEFKGGLGGHSDIHKQYHTVTHLMYKALRDVLGEHVTQRGSNITEERTRFDFSHPAKMTDEEKTKVEKIVNQKIAEDLPVTVEELPTKEAFAGGAYGAFGDKYGDKVKVYKIGEPGEEPFSNEICGGPHVEHTGQIGEGGNGSTGSPRRKFKIVKEESSSAGVRRIKASLV